MSLRELIEPEFLVDDDFRHIPGENDGAVHLCFDVVAFAGDAAHAVLLPVQRARARLTASMSPSSGSRVSRLSKEAIALRVDWVSLKP